MSMAEKYININISIVQRGRQIHEQTQKTHVHVHVSTNFRTYSANVTKNYCTGSCKAGAPNYPN